MVAGRAKTAVFAVIYKTARPLGSAEVLPEMLMHTVTDHQHMQLALAVARTKLCPLTTTVEVPSYLVVKSPQQALWQQALQQQALQALRLPGPLSPRGSFVEPAGPLAAAAAVAAAAAAALTAAAAPRQQSLLCTAARQLVHAGWKG